MANAASKTAPHVLLLTGMPGVGKTTVLRRAAERFRARHLGGFYTEEIRYRGARRGFRLIGFDGRECLIAHVDFPGPARVSKYGVDVPALDAAAGGLLADADAEIYFVDEIGKMECLSARFVAAMRQLLGSGRPVVATVALKGGGFIAEVKRRRDAVLWEITRANREDLPARIETWLAERLGR